MNLEEMVLDIEQQTEVKAPIEEVFRGLIHRFGEGFTRPDGESMQMVLEAWPGGRWFRNRGEGTGHLWGHVQTIKTPVLLELSGPMFMSYPAVNHLEVKLAETERGTRLTLRHRALGLLEAAHRNGIATGWKAMIDAISEEFGEVATAAGADSGA